MRPRSVILAAAVEVLAIVALGATTHADEWDVGNDTDNAITTDNSLFHGAEQTHDLGALGAGVADQDWYLVSGRRFSSYQAVIDGVTGDLDFTSSSLQLTDDAGVVLGSGGVTDSGTQVALNLLFLDEIPDRYVRVHGAACGGACTAQARYRVRFYDTTYTVPRFNNSGTQSTVLIVLNTSDRACSATYQFFRNDGTHVASRLVSLSPSQVDVFPLASEAQLAGVSGSIRIVHRCGYGRLSGKAVSLEPSTGFVFETPLVPRPH
jgi:hypothetical protein